MSNLRNLALIIHHEADDDVMNEIYENDIEEVVGDSSDDELVIETSTTKQSTTNIPGSSSEEVISSDTDPELPEIVGIRTYRKKLTYQLSKENKQKLKEEYDYLQSTVLDLDKPPKPRWRRKKILDQAFDICKELKKEEHKLLIEGESAQQTHAVLTQRLRKLQRRKKRKSNLNANREISGSESLQAGSQDKKLVSVDEKLVGTKPVEEEIKIKANDEDKFKQVDGIQKKKSKKLSGLSDEDKEYRYMENRIDELTYECDSLWEEIKDDEEISDGEFEAMIRHNNSLFDAAKAPQKECVAETSQPQEKLLSTPTKVTLLKVKDLTSENLLSTPPKVSLIKVKDISQLMPEKANTFELLQTKSGPSNILALTLNKPCVVPIKPKTELAEGKLKMEQNHSIEKQSVITISDGSESDSSDVIIIN